MPRDAAPRLRAAARAPAWGDTLEQPPKPSGGHGAVIVGVLVVVLALGGGIGVGRAATHRVAIAQATPATTRDDATTTGAGHLDARRRRDPRERRQPGCRGHQHEPVGGNAAAGTGMVLTPNGQVLTNNHVIADET